jgi:hypothetical protein
VPCDETGRGFGPPWKGDQGVKRIFEDSPVAGYQLFRYEKRKPDGTTTILPNYYIRHRGKETCTGTDRIKDAKTAVKKMAEIQHLLMDMYGTVNQEQLRTLETMAGGKQRLRALSAVHEEPRRQFRRVEDAEQPRVGPSASLPDSKFLLAGRKEQEPDG